MNIFKEAEKVAKSELKKNRKTFLKKRVTVQERIEISRYKKIRELAKENKITLSKMLDEIIDSFLLKHL